LFGNVSKKKLKIFNTSTLKQYKIIKKINLLKIIISTTFLNTKLKIYLKTRVLRKQNAAKT
jgi:hypothetical protein